MGFEPTRPFAGPQASWQRSPGLLKQPAFQCSIPDYETPALSLPSSASYPCVCLRFCFRTLETASSTTIKMAAGSVDWPPPKSLSCRIGKTSRSAASSPMFPHSGIGSPLHQNPLRLGRETPIASQHILSLHEGFREGYGLVLEGEHRHQFSW